MGYLLHMATLAEVQTECLKRLLEAQGGIVHDLPAVKTLGDAWINDLVTIANYNQKQRE